MKKRMPRTLFCSSLLLAGSCALYSSAADVTISSGENAAYSTLTDFDASTNIVGPTSGEKGIFTMDTADEKFSGNRYKGTISGNLDVYYTGKSNWRMYTNNTYTGDTYHNSPANVYLTTGKELGTGTIYWNSGQIVNEGNEGYRDCVIQNNIVLGAGNHTARAGWNILNAPSKMTFNGIISGEGKLSFNHGEGTPGTVYLNGANTYTGGTILYGTPSGGSPAAPYAAYVLGNNSALGTGEVVAEGATVLDVSAITSLTNNLSFRNNGDYSSHVIQNTGANTVVIGKAGETPSTFKVQPTAASVTLKNTGAGTLSLIGNVILENDLHLSNTGTGNVTLGTAANPVRPTGTNAGKGTVVFDTSGTMYANLPAVGITGPTAQGEKAVVYFTSPDWAGVYNQKLSGNLDIVVQQATRFINGESDFVGNITIRNNTYFRTGHEMGNRKTNVITMESGQIVNQDQSNPVIPNDIVLNKSVTVRAGWNGTDFAGGDRSSITFLGDISGTGGINFNAETNAGAIYLRGNNSYSGSSNINYGYNADKSLNHRSWFGIGSDSAFGTGTIFLNNDIPTTVLNFETDTAQRTLSNKIEVNRNSLEFSAGGENDAFIKSTITGSSTLPIQFGSTLTPDENVGRLFFNGTTEKDAVVNAGAVLGGTGTLGDLTISEDAVLYLSSEMNYGADKDFSVENLVLNGTAQIDVNAETGTELALLNADSAVIGNDFELVINLVGETKDLTITLMDLGTSEDLGGLLRDVTVNGLYDGWGVYQIDGKLLLGNSNAVPEPSSWVILLVGLTSGLCLLRRKFSGK